MSNINQRLNGLDVFAYMGTNANQPTDFRTQSFDPTSNDSKNFYLGTWWLNTTTLALWYLASLSGNVATWQRVTLDGIETLTGNTGGAVSPDNVGNIDVVGDGVTITIAGNPGTNTLTASVMGAVATSFPTDAGIATPAAGILNVFGGTAGRDINTTGAGNTVRVHLNNAITLGDLAVITTGNNAITLTSGNLTLSGTGAGAAGNILMPNTSTDGRQGVLLKGGTRFISNVGTSNTFVGEGSGNFTTTGAGTNVGVGSLCMASLTTGAGNTALGYTAMNNETTGGASTAVGAGALGASNGGGSNTAVGWTCMQTLTTGSFNVGVGTSCSDSITTGTNNTSAGYLALASITTGSFNTALGQEAGDGLTVADSNNICIANTGTAGDNNTIRIGVSGAGQAQQNKTFIAGIRGITTVNNNAIAVLIDSAGQLGTVSSSRRFKENIEDMGSYSDDLMDLRPVTFNYKENSTKDRSVGLIAEEVEMVMPDLVVYDDKGLPQTVKHHDLVPMLLNELQKMSRAIMALEVRLEELESKD